MRRRTIKQKLAHASREIEVVEVVPGLAVHHDDDRWTVVHTLTGCIVPAVTPDPERAAAFCYVLQRITPFRWDDPHRDWSEEIQWSEEQFAALTAATEGWEQAITHNPASRPVLNGPMP